MERLAAVLLDLGPVGPWIERVHFSSGDPYGRTVVHADAGLELMIAGWSRGRWCAPHDHGEGYGAVMVLQGRAQHRGYVWHHGVPRPEPAERLGPGTVLRCPRGWVHQMRDDGDEHPLVTLHLYRGPTAPMVVYDLERERTQWLADGCGAWPRAPEDPAVLRSASGLVPRTRG